MLRYKWSKTLYLNEVKAVDDEFDWVKPHEQPSPKPGIEADEYAFIEQSLQRYHDRDYRKE